MCAAAAVQAPPLYNSSHPRPACSLSVLPPQDKQKTIGFCCLGVGCEHYEFCPRSNCWCEPENRHRRSAATRFPRRSRHPWVRDCDVGESLAASHCLFLNSTLRSPFAAPPQRPRASVTRHRCRRHCAGDRRCTSACFKALTACAGARVMCAHLSIAGMRAAFVDDLDVLGD